MLASVLASTAGLSNAGTVAVTAETFFKGVVTNTGAFFFQGAISNSLVNSGGFTLNNNANRHGVSGQQWHHQCFLQKP